MLAEDRTRRELILLATTEAWERFSYYGIRGLLVLFLTASAATGGMGELEGLGASLVQSGFVNTGQWQPCTAHDRRTSG